MAAIGSRSRFMVQSIFGSRGVVIAGNWYPTSHLASLARRRGPWYPMGWWRSVYDRVSRVLAYTTSPRAKLDSDRYWLSLVLDNGTPERPWPTTKSMCSKVAWFRARNSIEIGVAAPLPTSSLHVARAGNTKLDRYP